MNLARWWPVALLGAAAVGLWWLQGFASEFGMFEGRLGFSLDLAASITTATVCVVAAAELITGIGYAIFTEADPTGFERAGAYVVLSAIALLAVLSHFGVNVTTLLATSAVLTAVIGLALQPTLGGLIAGFTLNADRLLRIGDGLIHNGETMTVTAIGWRSVSAARDDGITVVLSNNRIIDGTTSILAGGSPIRAELTVLAPLASEPHRVGDLIAAVLADIRGIDASLPITAALVSFDPEKAQARYRLRYWVGSLDARAPVEEEVFAKLWYAFQREALPWPVSTNFSGEFAQQVPSLAAAPWRARVDAVLESLRQRPDTTILRDLTADEVVARGSLFLYADRERMILPGRVEGCRCVLLHGTLRGEAATNAPSLNRGRRPRRVELQALSSDLAQAIGPFAEVAVRRAALDGHDLETIRAEVAEEIGDCRQRRFFLDSAGTVPPSQEFGPGYILYLRRDEVGALQSFPLLRADGPVAILALPEPAR